MAPAAIARMPTWNHESLFLLGLMGIALAVTALLTHGLRPIQRWLVVGIVTAAAGFGVHWVADLHADPLHPVLLLSAGAVAVALYRSHRLTKVGRACAAFFRIPQARWGLALAVALILTVGSAMVLSEGDELFNPPSSPTFAVREQLRKADRPPASTDLGQDIALWELPAPDVPQLADVDLNFLRNYAVEARAIRTAEVDGHSNCHGWVFAGGRYWLTADGVEEILRDNGYREAANPRAGDVVVYREPSGKVLHSGVVRGTSDDGRILVESKWGALGRFIHIADDQPYPGSATFYHSRRGGNLIRGLDTSPSPVRSLNGG
jgi:hypothetical protein